LAISWPVVVAKLCINYVKRSDKCKEESLTCVLVMKANEMHNFSDLFVKYSTCFGQVHCPSSGVSQHCIHAVGVCHASSVGCLLAECQILHCASAFSRRQQNSHDKHLLRVYSVEILLMMDSGLVRNMQSTL